MIRKSKRYYHFAAVASIALAAFATVGCESTDQNWQTGSRENWQQDSTAMGQDASMRRDASMRMSQTTMPSQPGGMVTQSLAFPTGERQSSTLLLQRSAPAEVRQNQPFKYQIQATNLTSGTLNNVTISERIPQQLSIRSSQLQGGEAIQPQRGAGDAPQSWQLGNLGPNESRTITIEAVTQAPGNIPLCMTANFQPALCTNVAVVNPQLKVTLSGPQTSLLCDPVQYTYTVSNTGTGTAPGVMIRQDLPGGLLTDQGKNALQINVGDLPAGQSKSYNIPLKAQQAGKFANQAQAMSGSDKVSSGEVITAVYEPELAVTARGPKFVFPGQQAKYNISVSNKSEYAAPNVVLAISGVQLDQPSRQLGTLKAGETRTFDVTVTNPSGENIALKADARASCGKPAAQQVVTAIRNVQALVVETVDMKDPISIGDITTYRVMVKNQSTGALKNLSVKAVLPEQMSFVSADGSTKVNAQGRNIDLGKIESLAAGQSVTWNLQVKGDRPGNARFETIVNADFLGDAITEYEPTTIITNRPATAEDQ